MLGLICALLVPLQKPDGHGTVRITAVLVVYVVPARVLLTCVSSMYAQYSPVMTTTPLLHVAPSSSPQLRHDVSSPVLMEYEPTKHASHEPNVLGALQ